jgi:sulfite exporter TauE/SafE
MYIHLHCQSSSEGGKKDAFGFGTQMNKATLGVFSRFIMNVSRFSWSNTVTEVSELDVGECSTLEHK